MLITPVFILLALYSAIIVASYCVVRRGWIRAYPVFVVGGAANALVMFTFSLVRGNTLLQATMVGPLLGFVFAALSVVIASVFRDSELSEVTAYRLIESTGSETRPFEQAPESAA